MTLYEILGTLETGFVFSLVALGAYITFRILDFPDLTVEGSFPLGAAVCATLIVGFQTNPWLATFAGCLAGFCAGWLTAWLNVRFGILHILAGILVSIGLYSVNLRIMSGPNKPILGKPTVFDTFAIAGVPSFYISPVVLGGFALVALLLLNLFLATGYGIATRAAGSNPAMSEAQGVNVGRMKLIGVGMANALAALGGALFAQIFGAADAYMGIGVIIVGMAAVIVGTSLIPSRTILAATFACIVGAILYRLVVALALNAGWMGLQASDVQLVTAVIVACVLILQRTGGGLKRKLLAGFTRNAEARS